VSAVAAVRGQLGGFTRILGIRDYRLLWSAQLVSTFGDRLTQVALTALVFSMTGSDASIGLLLTLTMLPKAAFGLFAGALGDRVSRKSLLVTTDYVRGVIVLVLALAGGLPLSTVYLLAALHATATVFFTPTRYAVLPDIVPEDQLLAANTLDETTQSSLDPVAFLIGGLLVGAVGFRIGFGVDAATFAVSAGLITLTTARGAARWRARRGSGAAGGPVAGGIGLWSGLHAIWNDRVLRANTLLVVGAAAVASAETPLSAMLVLTHWRRGAMGLGIFEAALAVGFVLGAVLCAPVIDRVGKGPSILLGLIGTGVCIAALAALPFWPAVAVMAVSGVFNILFFAPSITIMQERAPSAVRARVLCARTALTAIAVVVSYAGATVLTARFAPQMVMFALGLVLALGTAAVSRVPDLRRP